MSGPVHYRDADTLNNVPVTKLTPLPTSGANTDASMTVAGEDGATKATPVNPVPTRNFGADDTSANQITVGTSPTVLYPGNVKAVEVVIVNHGTTDVFLGKSNVTISTGALLNGAKGSSITLSSRSPIYGIVATGTQVCSYFATNDT